MKKLELNQLESIQGGGFWGSFCGTSSIIGGAAALAARAGLIAITGGTAAVGFAIIGVACGVALLTRESS